VDEKVGRWIADSSRPVDRRDDRHGAAGYEITDHFSGAAFRS
jgi:hypothetical protein